MRLINVCGSVKEMCEGQDQEVVVYVHCLTRDYESLQEGYSE